MKSYLEDSEANEIREKSETGEVQSNYWYGQKIKWNAQKEAPNLPRSLPSLIAKICLNAPSTPLESWR